MDKALPIWDLSDLLTDNDLQKQEQTLNALEGKATKFSQDYKGKLAHLTAESCLIMITSYENIQEEIGLWSSYAYLTFSCATNEEPVVQFYQTISERTSQIAKHLIFLSLELNKLPDAKIAEWLNHPTLQKYNIWFEQIRVYKDYQLSEEVETILLEKSITGSKAWVRLFDETLNQLSFVVQGKTLTLPEVLDCFSEADRSLRQEAALAFAHVFGEKQPLICLIYNTLIKDKLIEDAARNFPTPQTERHLANMIEPEIVAALVTTVEANYQNLSHKYYQLKATWLGQKQLEYWDRNAPLPFESTKKYSFEEAKTIVLQAYHAFSPELAEIGALFFEKNWIHAQPKKGKMSGAYAHPVITGKHPYIFLNYQGKVDDIMTLAHELGHGIHQYLARPQGPLLSDTPLTLAETASVFGEMLTFQHLLNQITDPQERKGLIAGKVEAMLNTVIRQIAFYRFEERCFQTRQKQELTANDFAQIWLNIQKESLGPAFHFDDSYQFYWSYVSHFFHVPFYVYAYAFGDCLVNSLYALYQEQPHGFSQKYTNLLKAGGSLPHTELLIPFGFSLNDPKFWNKGLSRISMLIDMCMNLK